MDVVRLGERYTTSYDPDVLIEGYSSFIWTERFYTDGEFELRTYEIKKTLNLLPEDTLISHLDTDEAMMVETHSIELDDDDVPQLVITGRSLTAMTEHRWVEGKYQKKRKMRRNYSTTGAAIVLLYNAFDNSSGNDVTRGDSDSDTAELNDYVWNTKDKIPNICITDSVIEDGESRRWWLVEGMLLPQLQKILSRGDIGLRIIRPSGGSDGTVATVMTNLADRGTIVRTFTEGINSLRFDLYDGLDRTVNQSTNPRVTFSTLQGDLDKAQFLYSMKEYKQVIEMMSSISMPDIYKDGTSGYEGIKRRVTGFDAGEPDIPPEPEKPDDLRKNATAEEREDHADEIDDWLDKHSAWKTKRNNIIDEFKEDSAKDATKELNHAKRISMLSGDISPYSPYKFRTHYNLGDKVTLTSDYAPDETMIVSEYVRTENTEGGDTGFPGLSAP